MTAGTRQTNTFDEGLRKLLSSITDLKLAPDADLPFVIGLETQIIQRIHQSVDNAMSGQPMGLGGMAAPPPTGAPSPVLGLQPGPSMPNPDELRRVLAR
jgi:hypothetical protein